MPDDPPYQAHPSAVIDEGAVIGQGTRIWHFCHICSGADVGSGCSLGQNVMVAAGAKVGDNVKIQNNVAVYSGVIVEDDAFLGPSCVLTNVSNPRSQVSRKSLYEKTLFLVALLLGQMQPSSAASLLVAMPLLGLEPLLPKMFPTTVLSWVILVGSKVT